MFGSLLLANVPLRGSGLVSIDVLDAALNVAFLALPLAIAISILRYRLYDIDSIISRTISYAVVTGLLGGMFALVVLIPTLLVGTQDTPDYLIAIATLIVAALFRPVGRRVQGVVDHRFNRARYDATRTVDTFTQRLREQIDLDGLGAELARVVDATMHPAHLSLWLRSGTRR